MNNLMKRMYNLPPPNHLNYPLNNHQQQNQSPHPPDDLEQKNIIDKLANFVSRNGQEFENITKEKQKDNPKFSFLFGGTHFGYYQYRLNVERELAANKQSMLPIHNTSMPPPFPSMTQIPQIGSLQQIPIMQAQINMIKEQIQQSESNLTAQREAFKNKTKIQIEEAIKQKQATFYDTLLKESQLDLASFEAVIDKIIESCTKEAIATGRNFVLSKCLTDKKFQMACHYLQQRILSQQSTDVVRLHLIYFINDMVHHGNKKGIELVKKNLELVIVPCFCFTIENICSESQEKMKKLLDLWEKNKYFSEIIIEKLRKPSISWRIYEDTLSTENESVRTTIEGEKNQQLDIYEKQNKEFVEHSNTQINFIQMQINQIIQQQILIQQQQKMQEDFMRQQQTHQPQSLMSSFPQQQPQTPAKPPSLMSINTNPQHSVPITQPPLTSLPPIQQSIPTISDFTRPPPIFNLPPPIIHTPTKLHVQPPPQLPTDFAKQYYSLPAGLICPLVKPSQIDYSPINPGFIQLPPPQLPSDNLVKAVETFYLTEKQTNSEGWLTNGLYEFYKEKIKIKLLLKQNSIEKYKKLQKEKEKKRSKSRSRSRSSRSRPRSTHKNRYRSRKYSSRSSTRSSSSSRSRSRSKSWRCQRTNSNRSSLKRSRSPTPPRVQFSANVDQRLDSSNKGHQLLQKMGYSGAGLGRKEQGILNPIKGGDVRDRNEMYKGVGVKSDPFEAFRKNKSQGYIQRLRTRDEIRKDEKGKNSQGYDY